MEINGVSPLNAQQAVLAALAQIAEREAVVPPGEGPAGAVCGVDLHGLPGDPGLSHGQGSFEHALGAGHGVERGPKTAKAESDAVHPDARPDRGAESALVQIFSRPNTPLPDAVRSVDDPTATALAGSEFSLPADQLMNAAVIGLQVEPAFPWQLQRRGFDAVPDPVPAPRHDTPAQPVAMEDVHRASERAIAASQHGAARTCAGRRG